MSYIIGSLIIIAVAYVVIRHRRNTDRDETEQGVDGGGGGDRGEQRLHGPDRGLQKVKAGASAALQADARWQAIENATPAQIDAWLANNVTDLASARRVLKVLILVVQTLGRFA